LNIILLMKIDFWFDLPSALFDIMQEHADEKDVESYRMLHLSYEVILYLNPRLITNSSIRLAKIWRQLSKIKLTVVNYF
jgi:hypothetical protein